MHYVNIADKNLDKDIVLSYHAHNNLQQAYQNAVSFVNLKLDRDILIDASVFGMGRGAGNLNLELFAEYLNKAIIRLHKKGKISKNNNAIIPGIR